MSPAGSSLPGRSSPSRSSPSIDLALWLASWLRGRSAADEVLDAMAVHAPLSLVAASDPITADRFGLSWPAPDATGLVTLLAVVRDQWRRAGAAATLRLVLPVPGDTRGLGTSMPFARVALETGQAVVVGAVRGHGIAVVPTDEGPDVLRWTVFALEIPATVAVESLGESEYLIRESVRGAAQALAVIARVDAAPGTGPDPRTQVAERLAHGHRLPNLPERVVRVLDTAEHVSAIIDVAQEFSAAQPLTAAAAADSEEVIAPLRAAVRTARTSAVDACVAEWFGDESARGT